MPDSLKDFLGQTWMGISGLQWLVAAMIVVGLTPLLLFVRSLVAARLRKLTTRSATDFDDFLVSLVERTRGWFFVLLSLRAATLVLDLPARWDHRAQVLLVVGGMVQGGVWAGSVVKYLVDRQFARHVHEGGIPPQVTPVAQTLLRFAGLILVWSIVLLAVLSSFGIDITALVAGLGVGGVAVALAVQRVLGDVLASVSIAVDKPFSPGDFIAVGDQSGTVRRIGMRSTVLGALGGEELVVTNNDLLQSRVQNYSRMQERRVTFKVGVTYDTPQERLEALSGLIRQVIEGREQIRFDRASLMGLADSALEYEVVYWVTSPDFNLYAKLHEQILFDLIRQMRAGGYDFAFPSRTLYVVPPEAPRTEGQSPAGQVLQDMPERA